MYINCKLQDGEESRAASLAGKRRLQKVKDWVAQGRSLLDFGDDNYANLLRVIVTDPEKIIHGLPGANTNELSTVAFAQHLYDMVKFPTRHPLGAPVLPKGAFWPALNVAIRHIEALATADRAKFVVQVLRITIEQLKIHFVPWHKPQAGPGHPSRCPVWDCWATLGKEDQCRHVDALVLHPEEALHKAAINAQNEAMGKDVNVTWSAAELKLRNLADYIG